MDIIKSGTYINNIARSFVLNYQNLFKQT